MALLSFRGPAGQIAVMHRILFEEKRWISENRLLHALNDCMLLACCCQVLNLSIWFALHAVFNTVKESHRLGMRLLIPVWDTLDPATLAIAAFVALFHFKTGMIETLVSCTCLGLVCLTNG